MWEGREVGEKRGAKERQGEGEILSDVTSNLTSIQEMAHTH